MEMLAEVQVVREPREWRSKQGDRHEVVEVVLVDKGRDRVAGVGLAVAIDRDEDPEGFKKALALKPDEKVQVGISGIRFSGGEYRLKGRMEKVNTKG